MLKNYHYDKSNDLMNWLSSWHSLGHKSGSSAGLLKTCDREGKVNEFEKLKDNNYLLNVTDLKPGIYFLTVITNNGNAIKKFVKQ